MARNLAIAPALTIDHYLSGVPAAMQTVLENLRRSIKKAAPGAVEVISYRIPTCKLNGVLVHFAAFENHCSFIVVDKHIIATFEKDLGGHKISGTTIHFTAANPIPSPLVKKIVKARIKQNEKRSALKTKK